MIEEPSRFGGKNPWLTAAAVVVVLAGLRAASPVILPVLVALFLVLVSLPFLQWLRRKRLPDLMAVALTILADVSALTLFGLLVSGAVAEFAETAPLYLEQLYRMALSALERLEQQGFVLSEWLGPERFNPGAVVDLATGVLGGTLKGVASAFSYVALVLLATIFLLLETVGLPSKVQAALGAGGFDLSALSSATADLQRYLALKTAISAATGLLVGVWVAVLDVDFPLLWGLLAFVLNYIPNIGSVIAAVPPAIIAVIQYGFGRAAVVGLGFLAINMVLGNLIEPHLMGRRFGLSTLVVFLSLVFWGWLWGPVGMLLSVPLTMAVKIVVRHTSESRWVVLLLGPSPPPAAPRQAPVAGETEGPPAAEASGS